MFRTPYNHVMPQSCVMITMKSTSSILFSFLLGLMVRLVVGKEVDLGEVFKPGLEGGRPLFEDVAYDSDIAFEIFMDEDESFNIAERNKDGPKAPKFNNIMTESSDKKDESSESSDEKEGRDWNPDTPSRTSSFSTQMIVLVGLTVFYLDIVIF